MQISQNGIDLIKKFEGCSLCAYDDLTGRACGINDKLQGTLTIGYGHTGSDVYQGQTITQSQADEILKRDVKVYADYVNQAQSNGIINFELNQNMFDSLTSFVYNLGQSNLTKLCLYRTPTQVAEHITAYVNKGSVWEEGLTKRRNAEKDLFLKPCENVLRETIQNNGGDYMSKTYQNGSTPEPVYSDERLVLKIGSLNAYEKCEAIADINGKIVVLYNSANGKKTGFVKYRGGL
jgi:GH24 family phage-related lysozyme (muramidase)